MHYLHRKSHKVGYAAMKVDMAKAYDRVEWKFIEKVMLRIGPHDRWVTLIMQCIKTVRFNILHDGEEIGLIISQRGLKQGDPSSPYLFTLCAEALSALMHSKESRGQIYGCKIARGAPSITHLFLADDCFINFRANEAEANVIKQILSVYGGAIEQRVNHHKSSTSFSNNVDQIERAMICSVLEVQRTTYHGKYIGIYPIIHWP